MDLLVAGCGYVGCRLAGMALREGWEGVYGLRRDPSGVPEGVRPVAADVTRPASLGDVPAHLDAIAYAVSPGGRSPSAYRAAYVEGLDAVLDAAAGEGGTFPGPVVLVTSTGVYGRTDGGWVDEETEPDPADETGRILLEAEAVVRARGRPGVALRLGGIYGPGRTRLIRRVVAGEADCPPAGRYSNRIHRDDAARAALHLLGLDDPDAVYVGVDREPAELREVYRWIAERADVPDPCAGDDVEAWEARGRRGTNKRCSSERLVRSGFTFRYPTFREGYAELMARADGD